jgi:hypothetical protein
MKRVTNRLLIGGAVIVFIALALAVAIPNFVPARACACGDKPESILNDLSELDAAKMQWTMDHKEITATNLTWNDLYPYVGRDIWNNPVAGETYLINKLDEPVSAFLRIKAGWIPANSEVRFSSLGYDRKIQIRSTAPGSPWTEP